MRKWILGFALVLGMATAVGALEQSTPALTTTGVIQLRRMLGALTFLNGSAISDSASGKLLLTGTTPMLQIGGTTASFPALKQNNAGLDIKLADDSGYARISANNYIFTNYLAPGSGVVLISATAPTISSGFGTSPSIASNNGAAAFTINVGGGAAATSGVIGLPTATTGWNCWVNDLTAAAAHVAYNTRQTVSSTTTATVENQTTSTGAAIAWGANDILRVSCFAY